MLEIALIDNNKLLRTPTEIVNLAGVNIKPQGMNVQLVLFQALLQKPITGNILQLLQGVDLRQSVFYTELLFWINVCCEFPKGRLALEEQRLVVVVLFQLIEGVDAGLSVSAKPGPERRQSSVFLQINCGFPVRRLGNTLPGMQIPGPGVYTAG